MELQDSTFINAPIFHSMYCRDCDKKMQGGFQQKDGKFLCAKCVTNIVETNGMIFCAQKAIEVIDEQLKINRRPTKKELKRAKSWLKAIIKVGK